MIIDTSAIIAILKKEAVRSALIDVLKVEPNLKMSAGTRIELGIVVGAQMLKSPQDVSIEDFLVGLGVVVIPMDIVQARIAIDAYSKFGKGQKHSAQLNFGDTFAYALAKQLNEPLLFVGDDFSQTDVLVAAYESDTQV
jgi:ribonuclease VapC